MFNSEGCDDCNCNGTDSHSTKLSGKTEGYGTLLRKKLDAKMVKQFGCQMKTLRPLDAHSESKNMSSSVHIEVRYKEQPERFRMLMLQGCLPHKSIDGTLFIRLESHQDVWSRLVAPKPPHLDQPEIQEVSSEKPRLSSSATQQLLERLAERQPCPPSSERADSQPADVRRFRDPAEQQAHIDRLLRPRQPTGDVFASDVTKGATTAPGSASAVLRRPLGSSSSCPKVLMAGSQSHSRFALIGGAALGTPNLDSTQQPSVAPARLDDIVGPLSFPRAAAVSCTRAQQLEQVERLAKPRALSTTPSSPVAVVKGSAAQQREQCSRLSMPRQRLQTLRAPASDSPSVLETGVAAMRAEPVQNFGMTTKEFAMAGHMHRASTVRVKKPTPYEVSVFPPPAKSTSSGSSQAGRHGVGQRHARVQPKLISNHNKCGSAEASIQQMLTMLEKINNADAEEANAILASVRRLYVGYLRSSNGSNQAQPVGLGNGLVNQFCEAAGVASVFDRIGPLVATSLLQSDSEVVSNDETVHKVIAKVHSDTNEQPLAEVQEFQSVASNFESAHTINCQDRFKPTPNRHRPAISHWMPEDMMGQL